MIDREKMDDLIEQYLLDRLSASEKNDLEKQFEDSPEVYERYVHHQNLLEALRNQDHFVFSKTTKQVIHQKRQRRNIYWIAAASVVILLIATLARLLVSTPEQEPNLQRLAMTHFEIYPDLKTDRESAADSVSMAFGYYNRQEFENAVKIFENIQRRDLRQRNLYIGICYLAMENSEIALNAFNTIRLTGKPEDEIVIWYKALSNLHLENTVEAESLFQQLIVNNTIYRQRAQLILQEIEPQ